MKQFLQKWSVTSIIFLFGVCCLLYLLSFAEDKVFFSGDGGVKYLMVKQVIQGNISPVLDLPSNPLVKKLWSYGHYPFHEPFVYEINQEKIIAFPLYFALVSSPFMSVFDWRGLYILPALSTILICGWLLYACATQLSRTAINVSLFALLFASPLLINGAMVWEHTIGAFFGFLPLILLFQKGKQGFSVSKIFTLGFISGLGVFIRPEVIVCLFAAIGAFFICIRESKVRDVLFFLGGVLLSVGIFLVANKIIDGHFLGVHSLHVVDDNFFSFSTISGAIYRTKELTFLFTKYWPLFIFAIVAFTFVWFSSYSRKNELFALSLIVLVSIPIVALITTDTGGKQWGPRYLLLLIPWGAVSVGLALEGIMQHRSIILRYVALSLLVVCIFGGVKVNMYDGIRHLKRDYQARVLPAYKVIERHQDKYVIVSHQYIAQELAGLMDKKYILRFQDNIYPILTELVRNEIRSVLFVIDKEHSLGLPEGTYEYLGESEIYVVGRLNLQLLLSHNS